MINPEDKIPGAQNFQWWEAFVTDQLAYRQDNDINSRFSPILFAEFLALPSHKQMEITNNIVAVGNKLQGARDTMRRAIPIDSWFRSQRLNEMVGGEDDSFHLVAAAADPKLSQQALAIFVTYFNDINGGLGYSMRQAHIDIGPRRRWPY